jgi:hypothetical protein
MFAIYLLEMLSIRSTGALKHRGTRDPGLLVRDVFLPLVVFGPLASRTLYINIL